MNIYIAIVGGTTRHDSGESIRNLDRSLNLQNSNWTIGTYSFCATYSFARDGGLARFLMHEYDNIHGIGIVGEAELFNIEELCRLLGCSKEISISKILLFAFQKWKFEIGSFLDGKFAFVIWNDGEKQAFVVRDKIGQYPLLYMEGNGQFVVTNRMQTFCAFSLKPRLSENQILRYTQTVSYKTDETIFKNVHRLPPASYLQIAGGNKKLDKYWKPRPRYDIGVDDSYDNCIEELRSKLLLAVGKIVTGYRRLGIELTGGLDSSTIAALIGKVNGHGLKNLTAFTNALPSSHKTLYNNFSDEWKYAAAVSKDLKIFRHVPVDTLEDEPLYAVNQSLDIVGYPVSNTFTNYQRALYRRAHEEKVELLTTGYGGNEIVSASASYDYKSNLIRSLDVKGLFEYYRTRGVNTGKSTLLTLYNYFNFIFRKKKLSKATLNYFREIWTGLFLKTEIISDSGEWEFFIKENSYAPYSTILEKSIMNVDKAFTVDRLEMGYYYTSYSGLSYSHPLWDIDLVEYFLSIPDQWKAANPAGRGMFKAAVKNLLNDDVIQQLNMPPTYIVPYTKVYFENNYFKLREACLDISPLNPVFNFVDRRKLEEETVNYVEDHYVIMENLLRLAIFVNAYK